MGRRSIFVACLVAAGLVGVCGVPALAVSPAPAARAASAASAPAPSWGVAREVPGTWPASGTGIVGISCASSGACTVAGDEGLSRPNIADSFLLTEKNGAWGKKEPVPGLAAFARGSALVSAIDCPAAGDCLLAGGYLSSVSPLTISVNGFIEQQVNGAWGKPAPVPGLARLATLGLAQATSLSCASPGNCLVAGEYEYGDGSNPSVSVFIAQEAGYKWSAAVQVPGLGGLNAGGEALIAGLSCPAAGDCVVSGDYLTAGGSGSARAASIRSVARDLRAGRPLSWRDRLGSHGGLGAWASLPADSPATATGGGPQPFAAIEAGGSWQDAAPVGPSLGPNDVGLASALSCPAAGQCVLAGMYAASLDVTVPDSFVVTQTGAGWSQPATFSSLALGRLACPAVGGCMAAVEDLSGVAKVVSEVNGTWGRATALPGATSLSYQGSKAQASQVDGLACPSAGNCTATGLYQASTPALPVATSAFVASEVGGKWSAARVPAGLPVLNTGGYGQITALDCASAASCALGGEYSPNDQDQGAFLLAEIPQQATSTLTGLSAAKVSYGQEQAERVSVTVTSHGHPTGKVTVKAGTRTVCVITLASGKGSCVLTARQLPVGTYHLVARYPGGFGFAPSAARAATLTVVS